MNNIDKVTSYIIDHAGKLTPEKIAALAKVIESLGGESQVTHEPNTLPVAENQDDLTTPGPIDFNEVDGVQVNDGPVNKVKIYPSYGTSET